MISQFRLKKDKKEFRGEEMAIFNNKKSQDHWDIVSH